MNNQMIEWGLDEKGIMWWRCPIHAEVNSYRECFQCKKGIVIWNSK